MTFRRGILLFFAFCASALAQAPVGEIGGTVIDASGALIQGATVTAISESTGAVRRIATDDKGNFQISTLQPGTYKIDVQYQGFQPYTIAVAVEVGQTARLNIRLTVAGAATKVGLYVCWPEKSMEKYTGTCRFEKDRNLRLGALPWCTASNYPTGTSNYA